MNAKEFLMRGRNIELHVKMLTERIEHYRTFVNSCSVVYSDIPRCTAGNDRLEDYTQKIVELERELKNVLADLVEVKYETSRAIHDVDNLLYQEVLAKRYITNEPWKKIAEDLGYSLQHVHRLHNAALKKITPCY